MWKVRADPRGQKGFLKNIRLKWTLHAPLWRPFAAIIELSLSETIPVFIKWLTYISFSSVIWSIIFHLFAQFVPGFNPQLLKKAINCSIQGSASSNSSTNSSSFFADDPITAIARFRGDFDGSLFFAQTLASRCQLMIN